MRIDHIGYAVKNIDKARKQMIAMGYSFEPTVIDEDRNIYIAFASMDGYRVELVSPLKQPGHEESPVDQILSKSGPSPYHICYASTDIEEDIKKLQNNRFKVIIPLAPAVAFDGRRVVFMYSLSLGLIEIVEE